jgi:hypothetical protein
VGGFADRDAGTGAEVVGQRLRLGRHTSTDSRVLWRIGDDDQSDDNNDVRLGHL